MKNKLPLLALVLLSGLPSSLAAPSPFHSPHLDYAFNTYVTPPERYQLALFALDPAAAIQTLTTLIAEIQHVPYVEGYLLVIGTLALALTVNAFQKNYAEKQTAQDYAPQQTAIVKVLPQQVAIVKVLPQQVAIEPILPEQTVIVLEPSDQTAVDPMLLRQVGIEPALLRQLVVSLAWPNPSIVPIGETLREAPELVERLAPIIRPIAEIEGVARAFTKLQVRLQITVINLNSFSIKFFKEALDPRTGNLISSMKPLLVDEEEVTDPIRFEIKAKKRAVIEAKAKLSFAEDSLERRFMAVNTDLDLGALDRPCLDPVERAELFNLLQLREAIDLNVLALIRDTAPEPEVIDLTMLNSEVAAYLKVTVKLTPLNRTALENVAARVAGLAGRQQVGKQTALEPKSPRMLMSGYTNAMLLKSLIASTRQLLNCIAPPEPRNIDLTQETNDSELIVLNLCDIPALVDAVLKVEARNFLA